MEVSMEQITYDTNRGSFYEYQQFVMDTLEKVKGNKKLEAKWKQIQKIIRSKESITLTNVEKIKSALIEAHANRIHNNFEENLIMMNSNQALSHEKYLLDLIITLATDKSNPQKGINNGSSTLNDTVSGNSLTPFSRNVYQSCFESYVHEKLLKTNTKIIKRAYTFKTERLKIIVNETNSKNLGDSQNNVTLIAHPVSDSETTKTVTTKESTKTSVPDSNSKDCEIFNYYVDDQFEITEVPEMSQGTIDNLFKQSEMTASNFTECIKPSVPDSNSEYYEILNYCADEQFEITEVTEMSQDVIDDPLKQIEMTASTETVDTSEIIEPSIPVYELEDCGTLNYVDNQFEIIEVTEMSQDVIDDPFKQSEMTASNFTECIKPSVPDSNSEYYEILNYCADEQFEITEVTEMSQDVIDDPLKQSEMTASDETVDTSEIIERSIPVSELEDCEKLNCADQLSKIYQGVVDGTLKKVEVTEPSKDNESDYSDAESIAKFYETLNRDSSKYEMLEALRKCFGNKGIAKLKNLFESENKISTKKAAEDKQLKEKSQPRTKNKPPGTKRNMREIDRMDENLELMKTTGKRKCASKKIDYNIDPYKEEIKKDKNNYLLRNQRKPKAQTTVNDKYYDDLSSHGSSKNQKMDQDYTDNKSKIKFIVNVVEHGNLEFIVDEGLLVYLKKKKST